MSSLYVYQGEVLMLNQDTNNDQAQGLRRMSASKPTKVIAVTAGKGGVGKTNVAVNLALALAKKKKKVLLFDGDLGLANIDVLLGLTAKYNLSHVVDNQCTLSDIVLEGPLGIKIVPAASGIEKMAMLNANAYAGIIEGFNSLTFNVDYLIIDTAAGISEEVLSLTRSSQDTIVVVCDEPTSITDAYALIKVLSKRHQMTKFHVLANMVREPGQGRELFTKLYRVAERFLDVTLDYVGAISYDELIHKAVKQQKPILSLYPNTLASRELKRLAEKVIQWPAINTLSGNSSFFVEKLAIQQCMESS